jgi:hypothetical protein
VTGTASTRPCSTPRYYSGKHRCHGVNVQVIADAAGRLKWVSAALPGSTHDLTAAREHGLVQALTTDEVMTFADKGYQGAAAVSAPRSSAIAGAVGCPVGKRPSTAVTPRSAPLENAPSPPSSAGSYWPSCTAAPSEQPICWPRSSSFNSSRSSGTQVERAHCSRDLPPCTVGGDVVIEQAAWHVAVARMHRHAVVLTEVGGQQLPEHHQRHSAAVPWMAN